MLRTKRSKLTTATVFGLATVLLSYGISAAHMVDMDGVGVTPNPTPTVYPTYGNGMQTKAIRYQAGTIPAPAPEAGGKHGMSMTGNVRVTGVEKPCSNCYITSMDARLVNPDGSTANYNNDIVLHHAVLTNSSKRDATCGVSLAGTIIGQRFFAAGAEGTKVALPPGYGYKVNKSDNWQLIYDLMSMAKVAKTVAIEVTYTYTSAVQKPAEPLWLDEVACPLLSQTFSEFTVEPGENTDTMTWNSGFSGAGNVLFAGGHVHDLGTSIEVSNTSTGKTICKSTPGYGESAEFVDHHGEVHLSTMSACVGTAANPVVATIGRFQNLKLTTKYSMGTQTDHHAMGIMLLYVG